MPAFSFDVDETIFVSPLLLPLNNVFICSLSNIIKWKHYVLRSECDLPWCLTICCLIGYMVLWTTNQSMFKSLIVIRTRKWTLLCCQLDWLYTQFLNFIKAVFGSCYGYFIKLNWIRLSLDILKLIFLFFWSSRTLISHTPESQIMPCSIDGEKSQMTINKLQLHNLDILWELCWQ